MTGSTKVSVAVLLAWLFLLVSRSAGAENMKQQFDEIAEAAQQKSGLDQIREINLSINTLLTTTHFFLKSPEANDWRSVDYILDSKYRDDCKDFVVLKEELLQRVGIKSERMPVMLRSTGELHVVLKIHYREREIILDNLRNVMVTMQDLSHAYELYNGIPLGQNSN
jgi:predicted transglutaminase-like cysteine proteinase